MVKNTRKQRKNLRSKRQRSKQRGGNNAANAAKQEFDLMLQYVPKSTWPSSYSKYLETYSNVDLLNAMKEATSHSVSIVSEIAKKYIKAVSS